MSRRHTVRVPRARGPRTAEAFAGARDIIAERVSDDKDARAKLRVIYQRDAIVSSKVLLGKDTAPEAAKFLNLAAAQAAQCQVLYSEDMQHLQRLGILQVVNPFLD